jgi:FAD/FMN-containing dehydrogenase
MSTTLLDNPVSVQDLPDLLPMLDWITDPERVARLSYDFAWFSPILKHELADKKAALVVRPRSTEEIRQVVSVCANSRIPITIRGGGTGNTGQSVPLSGGIILDLSGYNAFCWTRGLAGRAQAGIRLEDFNLHVRKKLLELPWLTASHPNATLGGFFNSHHGAEESIHFNPVSAAESILGILVMTVEKIPQLIELRGQEAMLLHKMCGTIGIVLEIEVCLSPYVPWIESIAKFHEFEQALEFASTLATSKEWGQQKIALLSAPLPNYMMPLVHDFNDQEHAALMILSPQMRDGIQKLVTSFGGQLVDRTNSEMSQNSQYSLINLMGHQTTSQALKVNKSLVYIECHFKSSVHLTQIRNSQRHLQDEVLMHIEFFCTPSGAFTCTGLPLVQFTTEARLNEIMAIYRSLGVQINNPHVYIVEDGKQNNLDPAVVKMKERFDPMGLLNPGKLRSWASREVRT